MSAIFKDTETIAGLPEGVAARPAAVPAESGAKPQPVALEVSVLVNGARTVEGSEKREPFAESTKTVLVFGNGAVIRLQASVAPGQLLFLTNDKTKKEVVCQVVKSKNYRNISGYVELEFTEAVVGFWGMRFPGDRLAAPTGTPNVVQATLATGSPVAPQIAALPAAPAGPFVVKTDFSVSSSAPKTVLPLTGTLSLPRAAEAKPAAPTPLAAAPNISAPDAPLAPIAPAPPVSAAVPVAAANRASSTPAGEPAKAAGDFSAESLRAENARLQEQLAALLNPQRHPAPIVPAAAEPAASAPVAAAKPAGPPTAKILEMSQAQPVKPEVAGMKNAQPGFSLPDLAAMLAQDPEAKRNADVPRTAGSAPPAAPVTPTAPKAIPPAHISTASLQSLLDDEQVNIPSWLEPLARNSGSTTAANDKVSGASFVEAAPAAHTDATPQDELDDVFEHRSDDLSDTLAKTSESESGGELQAAENGENWPVPTFGTRLSIDESGSSEGGGKGKLLAIAAVILVLVGGGGYWYTNGGNSPSTGSTRSAAAGNAEAQTTALPSDAPLEANPTTARTTPSAAVTPSPSGPSKNQGATPAPVNANLVVEKTRTAQPGNTSPASPATNAAPSFASVQQVTAPKHASLGDVHLAAPNVTRRSAEGAISDAEVSLGNAGPIENAPEASGFVSAAGPAVPAMPVTVGGAVVAAKLLKSMPPIYPSFAKTQRVSGDVKIDALIDATGRVTTMKVVSGPTALHQAAMDALHQWKYQPASLDGKAVPIHLTVTIQFRMQ